MHSCQHYCSCWHLATTSVSNKFICAVLTDGESFADVLIVNPGKQLHAVHLLRVDIVLRRFDSDGAEKVGTIGR